MSKKNLSAEQKIVEGLESLASSLEAGEVVTEQFTCRKVVLDLTPKRYSPQLVKDTRKKLKMSQSLFAQYLGVSRNLVCSWEQGTRIPNGMACRFMDEIRQNPEYFIDRLKDLVSPKAAC